jgi:hypothetical protein
MAAVRFTANFEFNLAQIAAYWAARDAPQAYANLLEELGAVVVGRPPLSIKHHLQVSFDLEGFWQAHHGDSA